MNDEPKHLDATKPGNFPVSHTSRPIIVGKQQLARDPMMREPQPAVAPTEPRPEPAEHRSLNLKPTVTKQDLDTQAATPANRPDQASAEDLPEAVIEAKVPPITQQNDEVQELINKKTYKVPISSTPTKRALKIIIAVAIMGVVIGLVLFYISMN